MLNIQEFTLVMIVISMQLLTAKKKWNNMLIIDWLKELWYIHIMEFCNATKKGC